MCADKACSWERREAWGLHLLRFHLRETGLLDESNQILKAAPHAIVARLEVRNRREQGILCDGTAETACCATLLQMIARRRNHKAAPGELLASVTPAFRNISGARLGPLEPSIVKAEQSNTSAVFGNRFILFLQRGCEKRASK